MAEKGDRIAGRLREDRIAAPRQTVWRTLDASRAASLRCAPGLQPAPPIPGDPRLRSGRRAMTSSRPGLGDRTGGGVEPERPAPDATSQRVEALAAVPLFGIIGRQQIEELAGFFVELSYQSGDTVCREGEQGDALFVVLSGELDVLGGDGRVINRLGPGEVLGEMSLLHGGTRAATVTVARSARLLALDRSAFERFLLPNPRVLEYFSRLLCQRLATMARGEVAERSTTAITVTSRPGLRGRSLVASALAALLRDFTGRGTLVVRAAAGRTGRHESPTLTELARMSPQRVRGGRGADGHAALLLASVGANGDEHSQAESVTRLIATLGERFAFLVFDLGGAAEPWVRAARDVSDVVVEVVEAPGQASARVTPARRRIFEVVNLHNGASRALPINHSEPFVIPDDPALRDLEPAARAEHVRANRRSPASPPLHRLARKILGASVGLAVGGGAAFGIAHVGVLQVLEDSGIPIDALAASSMGSIVALDYAPGRARLHAHPTGRPPLREASRRDLLAPERAREDLRSARLPVPRGGGRHRDRRARVDRHGRAGRRLPRQLGRADALGAGPARRTGAGRWGRGRPRSRRGRARDGGRPLHRGERRAAAQEGRRYRALASLSRREPVQPARLPRARRARDAEHVRRRHEHPADAAVRARQLQGDLGGRPHQPRSVGVHLDRVLPRARADRARRRGGRARAARDQAGAGGAAAGAGAARLSAGRPQPAPRPRPHRIGLPRSSPDRWRSGAVPSGRSCSSRAPC